MTVHYLCSDAGYNLLNVLYSPFSKDTILFTREILSAISFLDERNESKGNLPDDHHYHEIMRCLIRIQTFEYHDALEDVN